MVAACPLPGTPATAPAAEPHIELEADLSAWLVVGADATEVEWCWDITPIGRGPADRWYACAAPTDEQIAAVVDYWEGDRTREQAEEWIGDEVERLVAEEQ